MFGTDIGKNLGDNIHNASKEIKSGAKEIKDGMEKLGNIEKAALHVKEGMILTSLILGGAWIVTSILKKL